ncbi:PAP2 superfamily protein [Aphelenchoides avenae]|nr:PAP2 superfamily protein [Aphelenchus avenae]
MWPELQALDERLSAELVLPSALRVEGATVSPKNSFFYGGHRYIFLLMEWAAHGIPWLLASTGCVWLSHRNKWNPRDQWRALVLLFGILLDLAAIGIIKLVVQRQRPPYDRDDQAILREPAC